MAAGRYEESIFHNIFLFAKRTINTENDDLNRVATRKQGVLEKIGPGAGVKNGDFVKEQLGELYRRTTLSCTGRPPPPPPSPPPSSDSPDSCWGGGRVACYDRGSPHFF